MRCPTCGRGNSRELWFILFLTLVGFMTLVVIFGGLFIAAISLWEHGSPSWAMWWYLPFVFLVFGAMGMYFTDPDKKKV